MANSSFRNDRRTFKNARETGNTEDLYARKGSVQIEEQKRQRAEAEQNAAQEHAQRQRGIFRNLMGGIKEGITGEIDRKRQNLYDSWGTMPNALGTVGRAMKNSVKYGGPVPKGTKNKKDESSNDGSSSAEMNSKFNKLDGELKKQNTLVTDSIRKIDGKLEDILLATNRIDANINKLIYMMNNMPRQNNNVPVLEQPQKEPQPRDSRTGRFLPRNGARPAPRPTPPQTAPRTSTMSRVGMGVGRALGTGMLGVGTGLAVYDEYTQSGNAGRAGFVGGGALAGMIAGGKLGAMGGAFAGLPGAFVGGIAGSAIGGIAGSSLGRSLYDSIGGERAPSMAGGLLSSTTTNTERNLRGAENQTEALRNAANEIRVETNMYNINVKDSVTITAGGKIEFKGSEIVFNSAKITNNGQTGTSQAGGSGGGVGGASPGSQGGSSAGSNSSQGGGQSPGGSGPAQGQSGTNQGPFINGQLAGGLGPAPNFTTGTPSSGGSNQSTQSNGNQIVPNGPAAQMMRSIMAAETGRQGSETDPSRFIRTRVTPERNNGGHSSAYGPNQLTRGWLVNFRNRHGNNLPPEEKAYLDGLIEQGDRMLQTSRAGNYNDPTYGFGGRGTMGQTERQRQLYGQIARRGLIDAASRAGSYEQFIQSYRGMNDQGYFRKIEQEARRLGTTPQALFEQIRRMNPSQLPALPEEGQTQPGQSQPNSAPTPGMAPHSIVGANRTQRGNNTTFQTPSIAQRAGNLTPEARTALERFNSFAPPDTVITSTYRSPNHPIEAAKRTPGAHARGEAIDIRTTGRSVEQLQQTIAGLKRAGFNYVLLEGDHIHAEKRAGQTSFTVNNLRGGNPNISLEQARAAANGARYNDELPQNARNGQTPSNVREETREETANQTGGLYAAARRLIERNQGNAFPPVQGFGNDAAPSPNARGPIPNLNNPALSQPPRPVPGGSAQPGPLLNDAESRRGRAFGNVRVPYQDQVPPDLKMIEAEREMRRVGLLGDNEAQRGRAFNQVNSGAPRFAPMPVPSPVDRRGPETDDLVARLQAEEWKKAQESRALMEHAERQAAIVNEVNQTGSLINQRATDQAIAQSRQGSNVNVVQSSEPPRATTPSLGNDGNTPARATPSGQFAEEIESKSSGPLVEAPERNQVGIHRMGSRYTQ